METSTDIENLHWRETDDGSRTLWSENFQECYHSLKGARSEVEYLVVGALGLGNPAVLPERVNFLEVGFGLGWCWRVLSELFSSEPYGALELVSLENDPELLKLFEKENDVQFVESLLFGIPVKSITSGQSRLSVILSDGRDSLEALKPTPLKFHYVYQDPFSPGKNPDLWGQSWFFSLSQVVETSAKLVTYSASSALKRDLKATGWTVQSIPGFAAKRESTLAQWR